MALRVGIIGRSEHTYWTMELLENKGHEIAFIVTSKETPNYKLGSKDFQLYAKNKKIPFLHNPKIKSSDIKNLIGNTEVDICISVNYNGMIPKSVIDIFPYGILNAHGGDLPRYRGNACQAWAIINGEDQIGLCIHKMIGGELDSGPIIDRSYFPININTRIQEIYDWMDDEIPSLMLKALARLEKDPNYMLEKQSTNPADALRCYPRKPEDGRIDWSKNAEDIVRLINASSEPYSGAFSYLEGEKIIIWRAEVVTDNENWCGIAGQVSKIHQNGELEVLTGKGKIRIQLISRKLKKIAPGNLITSIRTRFKS